MDSCGCAEKRLLLAKYTNIARAFADAVADLDSVVRTVNLFEYNGLYAVAEAFLEDAVFAKDRLEQHVTRHGC